MLILLGFLSATLLALAAVPALARRADRLARRRAEAAFPLSLAEIAADRDHLRADLAVRARTLEQEAERGFAAKANAMQEIGRRDMTIARLERELKQGEVRILDLEGQLASTGDDLASMRDRLKSESTTHAETAAALAQRVADLSALEQTLGETRMSLSGTSGDLDARNSELASERATLGRVQALLAARETDLAGLRQDSDALRVSQVESRTQIMVLEGERDDLAARLAHAEGGLAQLRQGLKAMTVDRDSERLRADALHARAAQAEAGLAASAATSVSTTAETARLTQLLERETEGRQAEVSARQKSEAALSEAQGAVLDAHHKRDQDIAAMKEDLREREQRLETLHAEIQTLQGALAQARADRLRLKRELTQVGKTAAEPGADTAALRQEIVRVAERLMELPPKQEAAE